MAVYQLGLNKHIPSTLYISAAFRSIGLQVAGDSHHRHASADVAVGGCAVLRLGAGVPTSVSTGAHSALHTAAAAAATGCTVQRSHSRAKALP